jgi:hypothetical protein
VKRHDHSGFAECQVCEAVISEVVQEAIDLLDEHGYEVVKVAFEAERRTVYMGGRYDQFVVTVTPDRYRVLVVEKAVVA